MLKLQVLETNQEFELYQNKFLQSLGQVSSKTHPILNEYFHRSRVVSFIDESGEMVAGYILCGSGPLRLPQFVPNSETLAFNFDECLEVVCVWKDKKISKHLTHKYLWPNIMKDFLGSGKKYLLGHTQSEKLYQHYELMSPTILYEGPSVFDLPSRLFYYTRRKAYILRAIASVQSHLFRFMR